MPEMDRDREHDRPSSEGVRPLQNPKVAGASRSHRPDRGGPTTFRKLSRAALCRGLGMSAPLHPSTPTSSILLIVSEDTGQNFSCYGDTNVHTPHLDSLATDGVLFDNAYITQPVCSPSRSTIFTGLYPHQNGQIGLATHQYTMFRSFPTTYSIVKQAGYATGLIGKTHINPASAVEDYVDYRAIEDANFAKKELGEYARHTAAFIESAGDSPFFLTVNLPDTHWPFQDQVDGRPEKPFAPGDVTVMPYVGVTNPRIQEYAASYYNCVQRLDGCVGELLEALESSGRAENTLVIFIGDHGAQMARGKIWPLEAGVKVPLLVRWPGVAATGTRCTELVSTIDFLPTFLDVAELPPRYELPGQSLVPLLQGDHCEFRDYLAVERNSDVAFIHFPQRAIRDRRYKLIWSPVRDRSDPGVECYLGQSNPAYCGCPSTEELRSAPDRIQQVYDTWLNPPEYQLYDLEHDPWEFENLAGKAEHAEAEQRLEEALLDWMRQTDDWITDPSKLARLTAENDAVPPPGHGSPEGGWQYPNYLPQQ